MVTVYHQHGKNKVMRIIKKEDVHSILKHPLLYNRDASGAAHLPMNDDSFLYCYVVNCILHSFYFVFARVTIFICIITFLRGIPVY